MSRRHGPEEPPDEELPLFAKMDRMFEAIEFDPPATEIRFESGSMIVLRGNPIEERIAGTPIARARNTDPETSHAAAASVTNQRRIRGRILELFRAHGPMTDETLDPLGPGR